MRTFMYLGPVRLHFRSASRPECFRAAASPDAFSSACETQPTSSTLLCGNTVHCTIKVSRNNDMLTGERIALLKFKRPGSLGSGELAAPQREIVARALIAAHETHVTTDLLIPVLIDNVVDVGVAVDLLVIVNKAFHTHVLLLPVHLDLLPKPAECKMSKTKTAVHLDKCYVAKKSKNATVGFPMKDGGKKNQCAPWHRYPRSALPPRPLTLSMHRSKISSNLLLRPLTSRYSSEFGPELLNYRTRYMVMEN